MIERTAARARPPLHLVVAMPTCHRPAALEAALHSLLAAAVPPDTTLELLVVDNAIEPEAQAAAARAARAAPWPVHYLHQSVRGLARVRNTSLDWARNRGADALGFVDDDEVVDRRWLEALVAVARATGADAVIGRQRWRTARPAPWWFGPAFDLEIRGAPDTSRLGFGDGHSANALLMLGRAATDTVRFRPEYDFTGGEDTRFFDDVLLAGGTMVHAAHAITHESFGPERVSLRWWLARWYRTGNTTAAVEIATARSTRAGVVPRGLARVAIGTAGTLLAGPAWVLRRPAPLRFVRLACRGAGYLGAVAGTRYREYAAVPEPVSASASATSPDERTDA